MLRSLKNTKSSVAVYVGEDGIFDCGGCLPIE